MSGRDLRDLLRQGRGRRDAAVKVAKWTGFSVLMALCLWVLVSEAAFCWRHPWMTQTERFFWMWRGLTFGTVTEQEVREWEAK